MHLFLNGLAASAGGGLTYLRNVLPQLSRRTDVRVSAALPRALGQEFSSLPNLSLPEVDPCKGALGRFWQEQTTLPGLIRRVGAQVLVSTGNVALRKPPVPQILLSRNSLYTSAEFSEDLRRRRECGLWLDTVLKGRLARRSIFWADCTVAPTEAFAQELRRWTGRNVIAIHHGFDREEFFRDRTPLDETVRQKLEVGSSTDALRLLYVSHYNYYRNFETLFRALPLLQQRLGGRRVKLFLTCRLRSEENPGTYLAEGASNLVSQLGITAGVVELGTIPYSLLHHVYRACSIYVTPAYAESFAHPLVEAMASGLPIAAADLGVHREICRDAAVYFRNFSPEELAERIAHIASSDEFSRDLSDRGLKRSRDFSWSHHVDALLAVARSLVAGGETGETRG